MNDQLTLDGLPDPSRDMPGRYHRAGGDTERGSAQLVTPRSGTQRAQVLDVIRQAEHGVTDNELHYQHHIGAYPHVAGTRREELIADGWPIRDSGRRRRTRSNAPAIVWIFDHQTSQ